MCALKGNLTKRAAVCLALVAAAALVLVGCGGNLGAGTPLASSSTAAVIETPAGSVPSTLPASFTPVTPVTSPQTGATVGSPFLPGEVLAGIPVYPGAAPTTYFNYGYGPPSAPVDAPGYLSKRPGYQSASAQYTVDASPIDILGWYVSQLEAKGYRHGGENGGGGPTVAFRKMAFYLPSQPLVSVQVHVYSMSGNSMPIFELLVTNIVPLPRPPEESVPDDVDSVTIILAPGTGNEVVKTITDTQTVEGLVNMVNGLPVRPDHVILGGPGMFGQKVFRLVFRSPTRGDITVTKTTVEGVRFGDYPPLDDPHNLLEETVREMMGFTGLPS